jgi:hypothetical protein
MNSLQTHVIVVLSLVSILGFGIMAYLDSLNQILFSVFLATWGFIAGFATKLFFFNLSKQQSLGNYARHGFRLSVGIYENLSDTLNLLERYKKNSDSKEYQMEAVSEKLKTIQSFAISSNEHWKDSLPKESLNALKSIKEAQTKEYSLYPGIVIEEEQEEL